MMTTQARDIAPASLPVLQDERPSGGTRLPAPSPEPSALRLIVTLGTAGFLSGLILVLAYLATAPAIERNRVAAIEKAVLQVLPGASRFEVFVDRGDRVVRHDPSLGGAPKAPVVYGGFDGADRLVGYAIPGSGPGFQDALEILIGWDPVRRRVVGMSVLETRETPGLGDKIITDDAFTSSFLDLAVDPAAVLVAPNRRQENNEVDGISGATISAAAIVKIVNASISSWDGRLPDQEALREMDSAEETPATGGSGPAGEAAR